MYPCRLLLVFLLLFPGIFYAQQLVEIPYLLDLSPVSVDSYHVPAKDVIVLPCDFAGSGFNMDRFADSVKKVGARIVGIDLVYSEYAASETFDQRKLNERRLETLRASIPELFDNNLVRWRLISQQANPSAEANKALFHGFVIHLLSPEDTYSGNSDDSLRTEREIAFVKELLKSGERISGPDAKDSSPPGYRPIVQYLPRLRRKRERGVRYDKRSIWFRKQDTAAVLVIADSFRSDTSYVYNYIFNDSTVIMTFRRHPDWQDVLVVEDVTGSMYPYMAQTFMWRRLNIDSVPIRKFVFFNDGDRNPDGPIGRSGGAYEIESGMIGEVEEEAYATMRKGSGGAAPENNLEALQYGITSFPESETLVLIADNFAPIRDLSLLKEMRRPVKIILCGVRGRVHYSYILLALQTGGSIYTMEEELTGLPSFTEGQQFVVGDQKFEIHNGSLRLVH